MYYSSIFFVILGNFANERGMLEKTKDPRAPYSFSVNQKERDRVDNLTLKFREIVDGGKPVRSVRDQFNKNHLLVMLLDHVDELDLLPVQDVVLKKYVLRPSGKINLEGKVSRSQPKK